MRYSLTQMLADIARDEQNKPAPNPATTLSQQEIRALRLKRRAQSSASTQPAAAKQEQHP